MKVLVPVKRVTDPYAKVKPFADGSGLDTGGLKFDVNPFDEIAVEEAVRMKEADPSVHVMAVSIGMAECEEQLRKALAIGADEALLVETSDPMDSTVVATELAEIVKEWGPDLVIMGKQATDDDCNQAGQMLAAKLGWPQATFACRIERTDGGLRVIRETDTGEEVVNMSLPCLVTTDLRLNEPRYIALPGIIKARSKKLEKTARRTSAVPKSFVTNYGSPPPRPPGRKVGSVEELLTALKEREVL